MAVYLDTKTVSTCSFDACAVRYQSTLFRYETVGRGSFDACAEISIRSVFPLHPNLYSALATASLLLQAPTLLHALLLLLLH